ncbi:hypothetical protein Q9L58_006581 [Maublancomyces gigas]|uniref:Uncharacterized protein n=1 Tax=Discina gigas TaxID=1032678 RepID=A0ABR3GEV2_9PEZI
MLRVVNLVPLESAKIAEFLKRYGESVKADKSKGGTSLYYWSAIAHLRFDSATQKIGFGVEPFDSWLKMTIGGKRK